ncbi:secreted salivary gland peptide, putative, partial [Ixodes scapularis]
FLTSSDTLYVMYLPVNPPIGALQCIISTMSEVAPRFPDIHRWILYIEATKGLTWQKKSVTLTMQNKGSTQASSSFKTNDFPRLGKEFPVVFVDSRCLIFRILSYTVDGRTGCAWWVKESARDSPLWHCKLIFYFFCGVSHRQIYNKDACDELMKHKNW